MDSQRYQKLFFAFLFGFAFFLLFFYITQSQELRNPYLGKIRYMMRNNENFLFTDNE